MLLDQILRPALTTAIQPGLRSTVINISADDALSGNWLFRIAKETDFGGGSTAENPFFIFDTQKIKGDLKVVAVDNQGKQYVGKKSLIN